MTEQLLHADHLTLEDAVWRALDLPPWEVFNAARADCPDRTAAEVANTYADLITIGVSDRYVQEVDVIKDTTAGLNAHSRLVTCHAIGRIAGAL